MEVTYKFDEDQMVQTPFGEHGIITMLGYTDGSPQYYVATQSGDTNRWYKEKELTAVDNNQ